MTSSPSEDPTASVDAWLRDRLHLTPNGFTSGTALLADYLAFCADRDVTPLSPPRFRSALGPRGLVAEQRGKVWGRVGAVLVKEPLAGPEARKASPKASKKPLEQAPRTKIAPRRESKPPVDDAFSESLRILLASAEHPEVAPKVAEVAPKVAEGAPKAPEAAPKAPEGAPKAPEAAPKAPKAPKAPEAAPKAPEAAPKAPEVAPKVVRQTPTVVDDADFLDDFDFLRPHVPRASHATKSAPLTHLPRRHS